MVMRRKMLCGGRGVWQDSGASAAFAEPPGTPGTGAAPARGADVTAGHEGPNAPAAEPVTRFPSPRSEGFTHKFKALIWRRSCARLLAEPALAGRPNVLSSSSSGNVSARSVNAHPFER